MRSPTQLKLESAPAYTVTHPFVVDEVEYSMGDTVDGDLVRTWPSFRSLLGADWLLPATADAAAFVVTHPFKIGRDYLVGDIVDGDVARVWPTFLNLLRIAWIIVAPVESVPTEPTSVAVTPPVKTASARVRISKRKASTTWTPRELDVARALILGASNQQIAQQLVVEVRTIKAHVSALLRKTGTDNRTALALHLVGNL